METNKIDVRAVIKAAADDKTCQCGHPKCSRQAERAQLLAAHDAAAELIKAAKRAQAVLALHNDSCPQLAAALARIGGLAAALARISGAA